MQDPIGVISLPYHYLHRWLSHHLHGGTGNVIKRLVSYLLKSFDSFQYSNAGSCPKIKYIKAGTHFACYHILQSKRVCMSNIADMYKIPEATAIPGLVVGAMYLHLGSFPAAV